MNVIHVPRPNLHNNLLIVLTIKFILQTRELSNQWHNMCVYIYIYIYIYIYWYDLCTWECRSRFSLDNNMNMLKGK
jgi:hypothetical protein